MCGRFFNQKIMDKSMRIPGGLQNKKGSLETMREDFIKEQNVKDTDSETTETQGAIHPDEGQQGQSQPGIPVGGTGVERVGRTDTGDSGKGGSDGREGNPGDRGEGGTGFGDKNQGSGSPGGSPAPDGTEAQRSQTDSNWISKMGQRILPRSKKF